MRYFTLLSIIFYSTVLSAQTSPIDFEPDGNGADWSWATFEAPEGEDNPTFTVEANPATDGINGSANAAKVDISYGTDATWGSAGCETDNAGMNMGMWSFDEDNSVVSVMVYQEGFAAPVALKFANTTFGAEFETIVPNVVADEWVEIQFDMSALIGSGLAPFSQLIFFPSYAPRETGHVVWFDNVTFGEGDPPAGDPMVSAPAPTIDEANVLSVYGETYMTNTVTNFNFNAFQGGGTISEVDLEGDGNLTGKIEGLTFYGAEWDAADLNEYIYVHLDYWSTSSTAFNFYLVDASAGIPGGDAQEPRFSFGPAGSDEVLVQGEWRSVFIPLQHFLDYPTPDFDYDLDDIFQYKFDGNGTLWFDNVYFTTEEVMSVSNLNRKDFQVFPNPSNNEWNINYQESIITSYRLFNVLGEMVKAENPNTNNVRIDAANLNTGLYFAYLETENGVQVIKLVRE